VNDRPKTLAGISLPNLTDRSSRPGILLGWPQKIVGGGRRKNSSSYSSGRTEIEVKTKTEGWQWKKDAGNEYDAFLLECVGLEDFPSSGAAITHRKASTRRGGKLPFLILNL